MYGGCRTVLSASTSRSDDMLDSWFSNYFLHKSSVPTNHISHAQNWHLSCKHPSILPFGQVSGASLGILSSSMGHIVQEWGSEMQLWRCKVSPDLPSAFGW